ncbi:MAG: multicopper oxidase domain-containing protein [Rhodocyclales bacterium]|nr:multicopper oxidase domain-containing protein [Rhodocyclales bacterium]
MPAQHAPNGAKPLILALLGALGAASAAAAPLPGGTLDPTLIPKYVTPLVVPPEMPRTALPPGSTLDGDYYEIAVRQFKQQILPPADSAGRPLGATTVWSYGSVNHPATFHYPAFTVEAQRGRRTTVKWINGLVDAEGNYLPHLFPVDQTLHWANPAQQCADGTARTDCAGADPAPYGGPVPMVTHVHGAHVRPQSDGYPEAWWLPAAKNIPAGYASRGSRWAQASHYAALAGAAGAGAAVFSYPNSQPSTTLWYHDHTLGMTRLNVYAGPAGFWLVRGRSGGAEDGLLAGTLPGPAPRIGEAPGTKHYEIPIVIQDRSFNADGSLFYPRDRAFFEGQESNEQMEIPFVGDPNHPSDIAPLWNPEAFFNVMVVNGKSWPYLDVERGRYRLRLLNGSNSRFLNLALRVVNADGSLGEELPFYQIGAEQGLLSDVVEVRTGAYVVHDDETNRAAALAPADPQQALLLAPAERADVIVDFAALPAGTRVRMTNTAPDAPFGGFPDMPADPATTGQVMEFVVGEAAGPAFTHPAQLALKDVEPLYTGLPPRRLSLNEEESAEVCVRVKPNGRLKYLGDVKPGPTFYADCQAAGGFAFAPKAAKLGTPTDGPLPWMAPVTENPGLHDTEEWEIHNTTEDAHPIHLHLVKFQVVCRQPMDKTGEGMGAAVSCAHGEGLEPWESGWKDTVIAYPGEITRIRATFDVPGLYVWHCHIVEHEDNEMMRPFCVGDPGSAACPVELFTGMPAGGM